VRFLLRKFVVHRFPELKVFDAVVVDKFYIDSEQNLYYFRNRHKSGLTEYGLRVGDTSEFEVPLTKETFELFAYKYHDRLTKEVLVFRLAEDDLQPIVLVELHYYAERDLSIMQIESTTKILDCFYYPDWVDAEIFETDVSMLVKSEKKVLSWEDEVAVGLEAREKKLGSTFEERLQKTAFRKGVKSHGKQ
jgi:hypothetical protein